jgi:hypothetical protein
MAAELVQQALQGTATAQAISYHAVMIGQALIGRAVPPIEASDYREVAAGIG